MNSIIAAKWRPCRVPPMAFLTILLSITILGGCETISHEDQAEVLGGVLGGVIGAQVGDGRGKTAAIIIGTLAGSMIGRHIGQTMDDADRSKAAMALNDSRTGQSTAWVNPDTGNRYSVTPTRTYDHNNYPCREFNLTTTVGNQDGQNVYGTACLQADGDWRLQ